MSLDFRRLALLISKRLLLWTVSDEYHIDDSPIFLISALLTCFDLRCFCLPI